MEGPYYKAGAPLRDSLAEPGAAAERLVLSGRVLGADCSPLAGVTLDFWHADDKGDYDNEGYRYRGRVMTDAQGRYRIETILPAPYPGRPRHIHVKIARAAGRALTTQLYFAEDAPARLRALALKPLRKDDRLHASFDFVI